MICRPCRDAADAVPGAEHCNEPANPGRASWSCTCQHRPPVRRAPKNRGRRRQGVTRP